MLKSKKIILLPLIVIVLFLAGCLVSGTFNVVKTIPFSTQTGYYPYAVDITDEADWEKHKDKLDEVELIGFELWITNFEPVEWKFWAYADNFNDECLSLSCFNESTTKFKIFDTLTVSAAVVTGGSHKYVSYVESFKYLGNQEKLKKMLLTGQFNYYGFATGGTSGSGGIVDSVRLIVTFNASDT